MSVSRDMDEDVLRLAINCAIIEATRSLSANNNGDKRKRVIDLLSEAATSFATVAARHRASQPPTPRAVVMLSDDERSDFGYLARLIMPAPMDRRSRRSAARLYFRALILLTKAVRFNLNRHAYWTEGWGKYYVKILTASGYIAWMYAAGCRFAIFNARVDISESLTELSGLLSVGPELVRARTS